MEDVGRPGRGLSYVRKRLAEIHPTQHTDTPPIDDLPGSEAQARASLRASLREMGIELHGSRTEEAIIGRMFRKQRASDEDERVERAFAFIHGLHGLTGAPLEVLERARTFLAEYGLGDQPLSRLAEVVAALDAYGIAESQVQVQLALGRGLHYYTDVVFELYDEVGQSQLCGGGRYNELVQSLGGRNSVPAVGFAIGLERIRLALEHQGDALPAPPQPQVLVAAALPDVPHTPVCGPRRSSASTASERNTICGNAPRARKSATPAGERFLTSCWLKTALRIYSSTIWQRAPQSHCL